MKKKVLLIDDEVELLDVIQDLIDVHVENCEIDMAASGAEALKLCEENLYDVISLDFKMPSMTGGEFLDLLVEKDNPNAHKPVIILTAFPLDAEYLTEKHKVYLAQKPISVDEYIKTVRLVLSSERQTA